MRNSIQSFDKRERILERKAALGITLTLLLASILTSAFEIQPLRASETIYIRNDGGVDPSTAPIQRDGNIYVLTDNISDASIVVERSGIVIDGADYVIQGTRAVNSWGITLKGRVAVTIRNTEIRAFSTGIMVSDSENIIVTGNNIKHNLWGIEIAIHSRNNKVFGNNITNNISGIVLSNCSNNTITRNNIKNNGGGIELRHAYDNSISENSIAQNNNGIWLSQSQKNNVISRNNITESHSSGIRFYESSNHSIISENCIRNNYFGITISDSSSNNTISGNNITANRRDGIRVIRTFNNSIIGNDIKNHLHGIMLSLCSDNNISKNNITNNTRGIILWETLNNKIYHNSFKNNTLQVYDLSENTTDQPSRNSWDDGYPYGGNYWIDYNGPDLYSGLYQNETGSDGIGDTPYIIDEKNQDNYPLMEPWTPLPETISESEANIKKQKRKQPSTHVSIKSSFIDSVFI